MKRKYIITILAIIIALILIGSIYYVNKIHSTDAYKFKREYEKLNGKKSSSGKTIREINIPTNNPIKYSTAKEIIEKIDNKETFAVYFGFAECPWCRSIIENLISVAKEKNVDTIYYVDVLNIRDVMEYKDGEVVTTKKGTKDYMKLVSYLKDVLDDYTLEDKDGNKIETGEKRIYAPNIVAVANGHIERMVDGISPNEDDPYMKLTKKINIESKKEIQCIFKCLEKANTCTSKTTC